MRDLFDDFMDELRRREAIARGETPDPPRKRGDGGERRPDDVDGGTDADDRDQDEATDDHDDDDGRAPRSIFEERDRRRGGPPRRPPGGPDDGAPERRRGRRIGLWIAVIVGLALFLLFTFGIDLWTDALWYASVGFDGVFWTRIAAQVGLFIGGLAIALLVLLGNLWIAGRLGPTAEPREGGGVRAFIDRLGQAAQAGADARTGRARPYGDDRTVYFEAGDLPDLTPLAGIALTLVGVLLALVLAATLASSWETVMLWAQRVPFSPDGATATTDPIFGRDISYFLFELPFLRLIQGAFNALVIVALILVLIRYLVTVSGGGLVFSTPIRVHLAVLGAAFLLSVAFGYQLDKYELVYSTRGVATGVSFTDQNAQFFAYDVLTVISGLAAAFLVGGAFTRMLWPLGLTIGIWFFASIIIGRLYPEAIQRFSVQPNQYAQEERYISNNIAMTRLAFGLDKWDVRSFQGEAVLTQQMIDEDQDTFRNARLWDYRPLGTTLDQLQTIKTYYDFTDVDTDRYDIGGVQRQVMLSGRELALEKVPNASSWVNQRIIYTHGFGVAMVPVNEVANEGQPRLFIGDLPPVSSGGAPTVTQPRIYFGERVSDYVITGAKQAEFDYPTGQGTADDSSGTSTRWSGTTGVKLDTTLNRLLFALRFRDLDLLISDQVTNQSQLLFHRTIQDRVARLAPFLRFDKDPYLVVDDAGRLVYVQDAYTTSDRFPNAQAFDPSGLEGTALGSGAFDYIRNSVKITMDAYDGTMHFYIADPSDPIIRDYARIFPSLFEPLSAMPTDLVKHLRFPEELFNVQTRMYGRYHVTDTQQFFRNDDVWTVPQGQTSEQSLPSEAYYVVMRMPGEAQAEFLLLQPMVPISRPNMIAWAAARMDPPNYGATRVYRFPSDTTIFGPAQIEARIDQDPIISQQITLWNQSGSSVVRGNLIVVPVGDSLIYLQPVYLQSTGSAFPEFRRIVVASPREVVWGATLSEALRLLLAAEASPGSTPSPGPSPGPTPTPAPGSTPGPVATPAPTSGTVEPLPADIPGLIAYANSHFQLAQAALRAGDFATYGTEMNKVDAALKRLDELAPSIGAGPGASPSPAP